VFVLSLIKRGLKNSSAAHLQCVSLPGEDEAERKVLGMRAKCR
jgi:hypothetical protein